MTRVCVDPIHENELCQRYRREVQGKVRTYWQVLWLSSRDKKTGQIADVTGFTPAWIRRLIHRFNNEGFDAIRDRHPDNPGGHPPLLNAELLAELDAAIENESPPAGGLWNSRRVSEWMTQRLGRPVREQRGWEYLQRLGYSNQGPRPTNAAADIEKQDAFKKGVWRRS